MTGTMLHAVNSLSLMLYTPAKKMMLPSLYRRQDQESYQLSNLSKVTQLVSHRIKISTRSASLQNQTLSHRSPYSQLPTPSPSSHEQGGSLLYRGSAQRKRPTNNREIIIQPGKCQN